MAVENVEDNTVEVILQKIKDKAEENGFDLTPNAEKIAKVKARFFGIDEWERCPCDRENSDRFCCSQLCKSDVINSGTCHCNCYKRRD